MSTQKFLNRMYELVIEKLGFRLIEYGEIFNAEREVLKTLAEELQIHVPEMSSDYTIEDKKEIAHDALRPIAQSCVVALLRALFSDAKDKSKNYDKERLEFLLKNDYVCKWESFPSEIGLDAENTWFAFSNTIECFLAPDLFNPPLELKYSGKNYLFSNIENGFNVMPMSSIKSDSL